MHKPDSRKVYVTILGVAVAGFIVDRVFLGGGFGPDAAAAADMTSAPIAEPAPKTSQGRLSERVAAAFDQAAANSAALVGQTPDLFDPAPAFGGPASGTEKTREALEAEFLRTHKLTVLSDSVVVINGVAMQLGSTEDEAPLVDGYRLTGIYREGRGKEMGAVLVKGDVTIRLPFNPSQTDQTAR